ncbi:UDP-3-O-acylglucosamine N-acyltransferase [Terrihabitans soli]|uniref:UDP-3-O-acylglucosamine N-acyltransferase n=1 Tax=Terrihabitans soli TaxID=708113 RepID=A0A6S6QKA6_9HYPH|nr:UDP-3-O-(3-hydroxymyristoyl)glucosamine N-acyltransferase [Terrihabitans soli]BCJ90774.1 UDP-3-O-acylglucosamine N-acyltransferase [Terrihabitans soli]
MGDPRFFAAPDAVSLSDIAAATGAELRGDGSRVVTGVAAIEQAGPSDLAYLDNAAYGSAIATTRAAAVVVARKLLDKAPAGLTLLVTDDPYRVFAQAAAKLFPAAMRSAPVFQERGIAPGAFVHPDARLEQDVTVDPGAVIGPRAEIGSGSVICANAVIGPDVRIGRSCSIGPGSSIVHALIGNRVTIHPGARIGQDGFGYAMGRKGHLKVPQIGRVIIQDDVDIGAGTCIDRGSTRDTIIGEGTKIDNLVQIAHNVVIGRHCIIVSQVGISGSCTLGDFAVLGGQVGLAGHLDIGAGAQIGAQSGVMQDVPPGARMGGSPALPMREWLRITAILRKMTRKGAPDEKL